MKSVSFFRNTWGRKSKSSKTTTPTLPDEVHLDAPSSSLIKPSFYEEPSAHNIQFEPLPLIDFSCGDGNGSLSSQSSSQQTENHGFSGFEHLEPSQVHFRLNGNHGALFNSSHGPPHNPSHGPPNINRQNLNPGRSARPSTAPSRPPRPPSLNLYSHPRPESASPRSPNRVRFAPAPQIRPPDSPSRHSFRHIGQTKGSFHESIKGPDSLDFEGPAPSVPQRRDSPTGITAQNHNRMVSKYMHFGEHSLGATALVITTTRPPSPSGSFRESPRTVHAVLDLSDLPSPRSLYHATSSSPHLPYVTQKPSRSKSESFKNDIEGKPFEDPLALFPSPPPLVIRKRRPKPLVLLPTPTLARLPPSPAFPSSPAISSADSTPPTTPTTPRPPQSPLSDVAPRKSLSTTSIPKCSPGRSLYSVPPPAYSPPNSPLPTPPTSPKVSSSTLAVPIDRRLRTAQSTAEFRPQRLQPSSIHRLTLSTPSSDFLTEPSRRRAHSRPDVLVAPSHLVKTFTFSTC
jgi:hypothetical protein